ncbi:hexokinase type 2 isoform X3 [Eurytemora carolleeae]|nr:hexokinase type 2 isoform X3 [Eurytemora carolleeae]|eukprot:XP_023332416.1 hexokinase type 2-like isoform X3 [Eurytemora affinis]
MLKIPRAPGGRRRTDSFSNLETPVHPNAPAPTPANSFIPASFLDSAPSYIDSSLLNLPPSQLLQAAGNLLLQPILPEPMTIQDNKRIIELKKLMQEFHLTDEQLKHIEKRMIMEINWGLAKASNETSNIKSYITYVTQLPTGREHGRFLALDLGGTNFRAILIELEAGTSSINMKTAKHPVSMDLMQGPGEDLFNFMADKLREFMVDHELLGHRYKLGFTFSFPTIQHSLSSADLATWTKGFVCSGVEGNDVGALLEKSISRHADLDIEVCAILNDTTGCLLACAYKRPDCAMGVILGTGTNASYVEDIANVELFEGTPGKHHQVVINTEWGALGNTGSLDFMRTRFDHLVDQNSMNPAKQVYEKLISGMYLGELTRHILVEAAEKKIIFSGCNTEVLQKKELFLTRHISEIEADEVGCTENMIQVLEEINLAEGATDLDYQILRYI